MDTFIGFLAVALGFSEKKQKQNIRKTKSLDEVIDEHFENTETKRKK